MVRRQARGGPGKRSSRGFYIILSLFLGAVLWAGIDMKRMKDAEFEVDLGLEQIIPADWKSTVLSDKKILVSVRGAKQTIASISQDSLLVEPKIPDTAFEGDMFEGRLGISPDQVRGLPPGVQAFAVTPNVITIRLDKVVTRYLTVEPGEILGTPAEGFVLGKVAKPEPPDLPVTGPKALLDNLSPDDVIRTSSLNVAGKRGTVKEWVKPLPFVKNGQVIDIDGTVGLTVDLVEAPVTKILEQPVDVKALIDSPFERYSDLTLSPPSVTVTVSGAKSVVDTLNPGEILVYADIRERLPAAPGEYNMKCRFIAPPRIQVVKIEPDTVKWVTRDAAAAGETQ